MYLNDILENKILAKISEFTEVASGAFIIMSSISSSLCLCETLINTVHSSTSLSLNSPMNCKHRSWKFCHSLRTKSFCLFCLFDLILFVPSTIFQLNRDGSSWVEPVLSYDKYVLLKGHNAVTPLRFEPAALRSRVKHSTTEPLRSQNQKLAMSLRNDIMRFSVLGFRSDIRIEFQAPVL